MYVMNLKNKNKKRNFNMYINLVELLDLENDVELKNDLKELYKDNDEKWYDGKLIKKVSFEEFVKELFEEELVDLINCRKDSGGFLDY
jgi:uncharacterized protein (UPF0335 family)